MKGKRAIPNNPIYCEILYKIGEKSVYPTEFCKEWFRKDNKIIGFPQAKHKKSVPALYRQMMKLHELGYLNITEEKKEGKKFEKNKKYFSMVWSKIVDDFLEHINYASKTIKREKIQNNIFLQSIFKDFFKQLGFHSEYSDLPLSDLFQFINDDNTLHNFKEDFEIKFVGEGWTIVSHDRKKTEKNAIKYLNERFGEDLGEQYWIFENFVKDTYSATHKSFLRYLTLALPNIVGRTLLPEELKNDGYDEAFKKLSKYTR